MAIPLGPQSNEQIEIDTLTDTLTVYQEQRKMEISPEIKHLVRINGHHVRVGTGGCSKIGLSDAEIKACRENDESKTHNDRTYLRLKRNPLLLIHFLVNSDKTEPHRLTALGLGFPYDGKERTAKFVVNTTELKNWIDDTSYSEENDNEVD